jgi:hypothetical protein
MSALGRTNRLVVIGPRELLFVSPLPVAPTTKSPFRFSARLPKFKKKKTFLGSYIGLSLGASPKPPWVRFADGFTAYYYFLKLKKWPCFWGPAPKPPWIRFADGFRLYKLLPF